jgi:hypothetical protein
MNDSSLASPERPLRSRWLLASPLLAALAVGAAGCEVHTEGEYYGDEGSLSIDWTLDDTDDPFACDDYDARTLELVIYDEDEGVATTVRPRCDDFDVTIDLPDGVYSLDATLLDRSGQDVSTTLSLDDIDVYAGEDTPLSIDFPQDSRR